MASALAQVPWEPCFVEPKVDRALENYARRRTGLPNGAVRYFAAAPWVAHAAVDLPPSVSQLMHLDGRTSSLIGLVVSQENACRFCFAAVRAMLWFQGMDRERVLHVEQEAARSDLPPKTQAAIGYARAQSRSGPSAAHAAWRAMRAAGVSLHEAREIAFTVALSDILNRLHTALAIPPLPMERMPEQWPMRLLRPLFERILRAHRSPGAALTDEPPSDQPYAALLRAYAGSPVGTVLARTLQAMWTSSHLTRRCKLLMFGVVSRGLPCQLCEHEISAALQREGLDPAAVARALTHLDGPQLTPEERLLMPFARETLWYQPAVLQRHTRAMAKNLSSEQLIEAVGVAALANGLCRMAAVVTTES
jgi:AhpD family alkylhydroperoxidase